MPPKPRARARGCALWARAARRALWATIGCPQRHSLLALGSASFRRRVRTDGCVGPLRSRPEGAGAISLKEFRLAQNRLGVKSFRGRRAGPGVHCRGNATEAQRLVALTACVSTLQEEPCLDSHGCDCGRRARGAAPGPPRRAADLRERRLSGRRLRNEHLAERRRSYDDRARRAFTCVGVGVGRGASHGPRSAALAASLNSFKTANGRTDLRIQRDLEVAGSMPYSSFDAHQTTTVCTQHVVTREAPCVADAFQAAALAAGVGRDALTAWEFERSVSASSMKP